MIKKIFLGFMALFIIMVFIGSNNPSVQDDDTENTGGSSMLYKLVNGGDK